MIIKNKLVSDLELRLTKMSPNAELNINRTLLEFWIDSSRDGLVIQKIAQDLGKRGIIDAAFIDKETLTVEFDSDSGKYVLVPTNGIVQLPEGRGIVQIINVTDDYALIKTDYDEFEVVDNLRYAKPELTRLFWYQDYGDNIVIHPAEVGTQSKSLLLRYVRADWGTDTALTEKYPITEDLIDPLLDLAVQKAANALQLGQTDILTNDIPADQ